MRWGLSSVFAVAALGYACSTFNDAESTSTPAVDAGGNDSDEDAGPSACAPIVADDSAPQECPGDLSTSPEHCGTCGHRCVESRCVEGRCVAERITTDQAASFAVDGTTFYAALGPDIFRGDVTKQPVVLEQFRQGIIGAIQRLDVYGGELYISHTDAQSIIGIADKQVRPNEHYFRLNTPRTNGLFYAGKVAHYLFPGEIDGMVLARVDTTVPGVKGLDDKRATSFAPVAKSGDEIFWSEKVANGANTNIWGPWEAAAPIIRVGNPIDAFAAEGTTVFFVAGGAVWRAEAGRATKIANEPGVAIDLALSGDDLFYLVRRDLAAEIDYDVYRVDKCRGGRPVHVFRSANLAAARLAVVEPYVIVGATNGIFITRR